VRNIVNKTKATKKRFESLFKGIPIPTYSWQKIDDNLILIDYNDAAEKITKGMIKNYVGIKVSEMYKNQPEILKDFYRCANDQVNIFREMKYGYMSTGEEKFLSVMYGFIPPDLVIVHTEDITEKKEVLERLKKSEQELKALNLKLKQRIDISEENYRTIFENTGTATIIVEENTTISLINGQFEELSGYSREEIEWKKSWTEFVSEEDLERMKKLHYSRRKDPESTLRKYEFRFVNREGNIRDILIVIDMIPGTKKSIASLLDITERKKAKEKLKDSEEKSRYLMDGITSVGIGIDIVTKDYKVLFQNQVLKEKFGDLTGKLCYENYMGLKAPCDLCPMIKALKNKTIESTELIAADGNNYEIFSAPYLDSDRATDKVIEIVMNITKRKQTEMRLRESEEKYRYLFDNAQVGLYWSGISDGKILECNDTFAKLFGYDTREECLATYNTSEHYIDPNARSEIIEEIRDNKEVKNYEIHVTKRDGTPIWLNISARMFEKENRIEGATIDITERKKAEQKLKENSEFIQNIFNAIQDGLSVLDLDLNIVNVNPFMTEMYGSFDQIVNRKCYDVYQKRSSPCPWCPSIKTIETGQLNTSIVPYPTGENPTGWIELTAFPLKNSDGVVEGIIEYVKDITERKKAEEKILESEENYRLISENAYDLISVFDEKFRFEYVNENIHNRVMGYNKEDLIGKNGMALIHPDDQKIVLEAFRDLNNTGEASIVGRIRHKNGQYVWTETKGKSFYDKNGVRKFLLITRDISERKQSRQKLIESEEKYREAYNRAEFYKDIFAHDINNILQSILSGMEVSELILNNPEQIENLKINARIIREQVIRGAELVSNVRKLSQLEETKQNLKNIEIFNALENVISLVKNSNKDKKIAYRIEKSVDGNLFVKANNFLEDMLKNLLINAIKHNRNLIIDITVRISREQISGINYVKMEFLDNGIGVDDTMKERIFKRRYNEDKSILGMGLGLSLVRGIIEIFNGKVWVEDKIEGDRSKGSNFVLLIPEVV